MSSCAHVIGLGKSGIAAARLLLREGWKVVLSDRNTAPLLSDVIPQLESEGITVRTGYCFSPDRETSLIVVSPGVPWDIPALIEARDQRIEVIGEAELAWRSLSDRPWVGITGTNGKTTTTALTAAIFQAAGLNAPACGNIGYAACDLALESAVPDWVVAELSSYQIEASSTLSPRIGLWTTFTPDHLARHKTLENYFSIKAKLLRHSEKVVLNGDDPYLKGNAPQLFPNAYWTSVKGPCAIAPLVPLAYIEDGWVTVETQPIVRADALNMVGNHNQQNLLLAVAAAHLAGIEAEAIARGVASFPGVPHRLERVGSWQDVDFINDSKATNYDAAEVGLGAVSAPTILIAGGEAKEGNDEAWLKVIHKKVVKVLLIGSAAPFFAQRLHETGFSQYEIFDTLDRAVKRSVELVPTLEPKTVLLSPACASFDQYPNFEARGDHFRSLCHNLLAESYD
ncbi:UDP-N-acetylmuramoyl-L-alanine--D-glutamate ligase [Oscillatoria sp. CS-180]|uniref:UDP-N-acetylmuramoyl-L-alanine--D-glutamate ligase n=1 Tax=Oscillatoria sp. CS-180 TaxID=3021720 RepID=UPI0023304673|nr:UDP-N-acetylmuramoyl-L-alanine--D-glutamate ligase [Oscillatoria sp. CS-180]MDB9528080.1 UDP-N-acetylmuramoyl-L-alanine--D-glutamate ligase [Oscillatoria sp. CS-180]